MVAEEVTGVSGVMGILSFGWAFLVLPLKWLWNRGTSHSAAHEELKKEFTEHRLHVAENHFSKEEVRSIIDGTVRPIQDSVQRIERSVEKIAERRAQSRPGGG